MILSNTGLGEPIANWAKHTEHAMGIRVGARGFVGKRYSRVLAQRGAIATPRWVRGTSLVYTTPESPKHEILNLATARYISCFLLSTRHPTLYSRRPHCHHWRYRCQQSLTTRAALHPAKPPTVEQDGGLEGE